MKTKIVLLWAIALCAIDQTIKIVIDKHFLDLRFDIIPPLFYFRPKFNHDYTWVNNLFGLGLGFWAHIVLLCFVVVIVVVLYDLFKTVSGNAKIVNTAFIFMFAGVFCFLIGTIFWGGCLDYIYLKPLFIFDLKDLYLNVFSILILYYFFKNRKMLDKEMNNYFKSKFKSLFGKEDKKEMYDKCTAYNKRFCAMAGVTSNDVTCEHES